MESALNIVGPPGTGKTHTLIDLISRYLRNGVEPFRICFSSFTRASVREAQKRVSAQFGLSEDDTPLFGTLHSLAFRQMGLTRDRVLSPKDWEAFCEGLNLRFTKGGGYVDEDLTEPAGEEEGDRLRRFYDWSRNLSLSPEKALEHSQGMFGDLALSTVLRFISEFESFKMEQGKYDFTDMLVYILRTGWVPPAEILILDEAQDLSPIQVSVFYQWANTVPTVITAGDPDQAIYTFHGADPRWLMEFPGKRHFLSRSWRVPRRPAAIAQNIIQRNENRYKEFGEWEPMDAEGAVYTDLSLEDVLRQLLTRPEESWYFLARNRFFLWQFAQALMDLGIPFRNLRGYAPEAPAGLVAALSLALGFEITLDQLHLLADKMPQKGWWERGAKARIRRESEQVPDRPITIWDLPDYGALSALTAALSNPATCMDPLQLEAAQRDYFLRVYKRFGMAGLTQKPKVTVSTIHGIKGGEAQNVAVLPDMTARTYRGYDEDPEPERRCWYVACSRTQSKDGAGGRLLILEANTRRAFDEF